MPLLRLADANPAQAKALVKLLSEAARRQGMADHSYIVGGAPRDVALGFDFKDVDVVVESKDGKNAVTLAEEVARMLGNLPVHPDQYGVVHIGPVPKTLVYDGVDLKGQKIEIVTSRKEKYDKSKDKGSYKPSEVEPGTILEDLLRRDFTFNALVWKLLDVAQGPDKAAILDLTGMGLQDLKDKIVRTPLDPSETFDDDPSRMLRAVRFAVKYGFDLDPATRKAIKAKAREISRLPYEVVDGILFEKILPLPDAKKALSIMKGLGLLDPVIEMIPANRLRRAVVDKVQNVSLLLTLSGFDIPTGLDKLTKDQQRMLRRIEDKLDHDDLETVYNKLLKPPVDMRRLIQDTGITGRERGEAIERARDIIVRDPFIKPDRLQQLLTTDILSGQERLAGRVVSRFLSS
jgi:tRNA nucleotidyltransferase/poly(A) polymerase